MSGSRTCPGCGLELPASGLPWNPRRHASPECWQLYGEVQGFELHHIELVRDYHQLAVDAYAAQHAWREVGGDVRPVPVAYALVGLHLALDRRVSGLEGPDLGRRRLAGMGLAARCGRRADRPLPGVIQPAVGAVWSTHADRSRWRWFMPSTFAAA
jgi:Family of unknown function (DUF5946)